MSASSPSAALAATLFGAYGCGRRSGPAGGRWARRSARLALWNDWLGMRNREARLVVEGERGCPSEQREERPEAHDEVLLHDRKDRGHDPVDEQAGRQERSVD